jgi:transcriptional regulator with XRE-family HTH domain
MNKFYAWMKENDKIQAQVAKKLGLCPSSLHDILHDKKIPSIKIAYDIEVYTNSDITVYDWLEQTNESATESPTIPPKANKNQRK